MKRLLTFIFALITCSLTFADVTVLVQAHAGTGLFLEEDTSGILDGSLLLAGFLDIGSYNALSASDQKTFSAIDPLFDDVAQYTFSGGSIFSNVEVAANLGTLNDQMYVWVFNNSSGIVATEMGIFTSTSWLWPNDLTTANLASSLIGAPGVILGAQSGSDYTLIAAVPEPAEFAMLIGVLALGVVLWRRRK